MSTQPNPIRRQIPPPPPGFTEEVKGSIPPPPPGFTEEVSAKPVPKAPPQPELSLRERINQNIASPDPSENRPLLERMTYGVGRALMAPVNMAREAVMPPETIEEHFAAAATPQLPQAGVIAERTIAKPMRELSSESGKSFAEGKPVRAVRQFALSNLPLVGPMVEGLYQQGIEKGDLGGTITEVGAGAYLGGRVAPKAPQAVRPLVQRGAQVMRRTATAPAEIIRHPIKSLDAAATSAARLVSRRAPEQNLLGAAQPGVNIPKAPQSAKIAGPEMQRVRAKLGMEIRGEEAMPRTAKLAAATERDIWQNELAPRLKAAGKFQQDMTPVAEAIEKSISPRTLRKYPKLAEQLREEVEFYRGRRMNLDEIEPEIEALNQELRAHYRSSDPGMTPAKQAALAEAKTLRRIFDKGLDAATEPATSSIKNRWGATRDMRRALDRQVIVMARQKGMPLYEALGLLGAGADIVEAVATFNLPVKAAGMRFAGNVLAKMRDANFQLEEAFHGKRAFQPARQTRWTPQPRPALPPARSIQAPEADLIGKPLITPPETEGLRVIQGRYGESPLEAFERGEIAQPMVQRGAKPVAPAGKETGKANAFLLRKQAKELYIQANRANTPETARRFIARARRLEEDAKALEGQSARAAMQAQDEANPVILTEAENKVFQILRNNTLHMDEVIERSGLPTQDVMSMLTEMEGKGAIAKAPGNHFSQAVNIDRIRVERAKPPENVKLQDVPGPPKPGFLKEVADRQAENLEAARAGRISMDKPAKVSLRETYEALSPELRANVDEMVELYKSADGFGKAGLAEQWGLDRPTWKGLPIQEKIARATGGKLPGSDRIDEVPFE